MIKNKDYENAYNDYIKGMKYKFISAKYNVSINTVKSWSRRYKWNTKRLSVQGEKCAKGFKLGNNQINLLSNIDNYNKMLDSISNEYDPVKMLDMSLMYISLINENNGFYDFNHDKLFKILKENM